MLSDAVTSIGTLTLFLAASTRVLPSILRLQQAVLNLRSAAGGATRTYQLVKELELQSVDQQGGGRQNLRLNLSSTYGRFTPSIDVRNVSLRYPDGHEQALLDVSFHAPAGTSVALVGPSGAGKSTLADVIMGILEPDEGMVELGGLSPRRAIGEWPSTVGYVPQTVYLADATIRANVALGLPEEVVDDADVWRALGRAQLEQFVRSLPNQLSTNIGENGTRLSGGQRQRLGLARALHPEPSILVLDEATSSLDTETEHAITETLRGLHGEITMVIVAHRLSTVLGCDLVVYMESGRLIASGSFTEVRATVPSLERQAQLSGL